MECLLLFCYDKQRVLLFIVPWQQHLLSFLKKEVEDIVFLAQKKLTLTAPYDFNFKSHNICHL